MSETLDNSTALSFLHDLWDGRPDGTAVQIWEKRSKKSYTYPQLDDAATHAVQAAQASDIYLAAGLIATPSAAPRKGRLNVNDVIGIPGLWADIDVNGGPDAKTDAAPDRDAALELAFKLLEPTILVNSGYGIQAWWLFEEPWIFHTVPEREQAMRLSQAFQQAIRVAATDAGFTLDATHDLARLMRLPGTLNHKSTTSPAPVERLEHDGPRHSVEALGGVARQHMQSLETVLQTLAGENIAVSVNGKPPQPPHDRIIELCDLDPDFDVVWNHRPATKTKQWSMSEYDMSIANALSRVGCTDQEIADALRYHRRRFGDEGGKGERVDYLKRTIGKARGREAHEASQREAEFEREDTIDRLTEVAAAPGGSPEATTATISLFAKVVGGPEIKELVQEGRDPDNSRFKLVLADGREVPLGSMDGLMNQDRFRRAFATVTSHLPKKVKAAKWDDVVQALLNAATINEGVEDTRAARALSWVERYCEHRVSTDQDAACAALDPFEKNEMIHVPLGALRQWLQKVLGERIAEIDLKLMLEAAGFERHTIAYTRRDGSRSSRSYFRAPADVLGQASRDEAVAA